MKQTPLQELLAYIHTDEPHEYLSSKNTAELIIAKIQELLPKEKTQIVDAFQKGHDDDLRGEYYVYSEFNSGEEYYKKTYVNEI